MSKSITFSVRHHGELAAGLRPYSDRITINVESGELGGAPGEFEDCMREALAEWFDGAVVVVGDFPPEPDYPDEN